MRNGIETASTPPGIYGVSSRRWTRVLMVGAIDGAPDDTPCIIRGIGLTGVQFETQFPLAAGDALRLRLAGNRTAAGTVTRYENRSAELRWSAVPQWAYELCKRRISQ